MVTDTIKLFKDYRDYVESITVDNREDLFTIMSTASKRLFQLFNINITIPEQGLAIAAITFETIIDNLKKKEIAGYDNWSVVIAKKLEIGYSSTIDDEYEKNGGFVPGIKHLYGDNSIDVEAKPDDKTVELCVLWNSMNITTETKFIKQVSVEALKHLDNIGIKLGSDELIMPIFITIYEIAVEYCKIRRAETKEFMYSINFLSCFTIKAVESDGEDVISIEPSISTKLELKSDGLASSKYDEE